MHGPALQHAIIPAAAYLQQLCACMATWGSWLASYATCRALVSMCTEEQIKRPGSPCLPACWHSWHAPAVPGKALPQICLQKRHRGLCPAGSYWPACTDNAAVTPAGLAVRLYICRAFLGSLSPQASMGSEAAVMPRRPPEEPYRLPCSPQPPFIRPAWLLTPLLCPCRHWQRRRPGRWPKRTGWTW